MQIDEMENNLYAIEDNRIKVKIKKIDFSMGSRRWK